MTPIWIVLILDRHADPEPLPFSTEELAVTFARDRAASLYDVQWDAQLNQAMIADGWVLWLPYGTEGDSIRVIRRTLDDHHG